MNLFRSLLARFKRSGRSKFHAVTCSVLCILSWLAVRWYLSRGNVDMLFFSELANVNKNNIERANHAPAYVHITYEAFQWFPPVFLTNYDLEIFYKYHQVYNLSQLYVDKPEGTIYIGETTFNDHNMECDGDFELSESEPFPLVEPADFVCQPLQCPLLVREQCSFRHFVETILSGLVQAHKLLLERGESVVLPDYCPWIVFDLVEKLGLTVRTNTTNYNFNAFTNHIKSCLTPPIQPEILKKARNLLKLSSPLTMHTKSALFISSGMDRGRFAAIVNPSAVYSLLLELHYDVIHMTSLDVIDLSDVSHLRTQLMNVQLIIGVHCDQMYGMLFAPENTVVVELLAADGTNVWSDHSTTWRMAVAMGHRYVISYHQTVKESLNITVNIATLRPFLESLL